MVLNVLKCRADTLGTRPFESISNEHSFYSFLKQIPAYKAYKLCVEAKTRKKTTTTTTTIKQTNKKSYRQTLSGDDGSSKREVGKNGFVVHYPSVTQQQQT